MHMRWLTQVGFALLGLAIGCHEGSNRTFDRLLFVRQGAGDKAFTVEPSGLPDALTVVVTHWQFRDTLVEFRCIRDGSNSGLFNS